MIKALFRIALIIISVIFLSNYFALPLWLRGNVMFSFMYVLAGFLILALSILL